MDVDKWPPDIGIEPYYADKWVTIYHGDCREILPQLPKVDLVLTDPPYGIGFMGKDWDRALPNKEIWSECLRVLKDGAFAFVMSIPRSDCLARMIISLEDSGLNVGFTPMYWTYASGFPKAQNIGKAVDKRLGTEREIVGRAKGMGKQNPEWNGIAQGRKENSFKPEYEATIATTPQAKALDGSYGGFQPKPAVEVIIVAMKPLSEKTFVDQALKNRKGITWLDDCRIPYESEGDKEGARFGTQMDIRGGNLKTPIGVKAKNVLSSQSGRFPANLLVSDDVLNDGRVTKSGKNAVRRLEGMFVEHHLGGVGDLQVYHPDSGSFSRYFDLDKWAQTLPFLIVPKASKSEKNKGLTGNGQYPERYGEMKGTETHAPNRQQKHQNFHPTVKPIKLMSYLITLGSREGDIILDPFLGSGTTALCAEKLNRRCIGIEIDEKYCEIAANRCVQEAVAAIQRGEY